MPTLFENITDGFYSAFFEPDPEKRRASIEAWIKDATPEIQSAIEDEIRACIESILKDTWTPEGWRRGAEKFVRPYNGKPLMDSYRLGLDIRLRQRVLTDTVVGVRSVEVQDRTIQAAKEALPEAKPAVTPRTRNPSGAAKADEYLFEEDAEARSFNNDRNDYPDEESYLASRGQ